jgi:hypothetical protein
VRSRVERIRYRECQKYRDATPILFRRDQRVPTRLLKAVELNGALESGAEVKRFYSR